MPSASVTQAQLRTQFFEYIFGTEEKGFLCLASTKALTPKAQSDFKQAFFEWPAQTDEIAQYISSCKDRNVYFCTTLLSERKREKKFCLPGYVAWADLDLVNPSDKEPEPSCIIETSPSRFQAYWRLDSITDPDILEDLSRRLTYHLGADKSGWDLTQLLRVPHTTNYKYVEKPKIEVVSVSGTRVPRQIILDLPDPELPVVGGNGSGPDLAEPMPVIASLPDVEYVMYAYKNELVRIEGFGVLYGREPEKNEDWSKMLWRLINICIEAGMNKEEVFSIAHNAACNKYNRDNRPPEYLWREVLKAWVNQKHLAVILDKEIIELAMPQLVDREIVEDSFILEYKKWGDAVTDAPPQYHELSCFVALSALVSGGLEIETSFGEVVPHLWGLVLGESTLTRKTTAMRMAMDIVTTLDEELILAHDGSPEGILTQISTRPKKVSILYRDEVAGLFEAFTKKDYMAGLPETFTLLYDVPKRLPRVLRKETIIVSEPYFIFFGGGIRDKVHSLLTEDFVLSGFIPRFLVVSGENNMERWRPIGPPTGQTEAMKDKVINEMGELKVLYNLGAEMEVAGQIITVPRKVKAILTPEAWEYSAQCERRLIAAAEESPYSMVAVPTFQRMAVSLLKMGTLVAATRRDYEGTQLTVEKEDLEQAAWYIQRWGKYMIELISQAGKPHTEREIEKVYRMIHKEPGILKSDLMRRNHLRTAQLRDIIETLMDRGLIDAKKVAQGTRYTSVV
jgi:hypothetical protein